MFSRLDSSSGEMITVSFEGKDLPVRKGLSVAAALLEAGILHFRNTPVSDSRRAPFCMMGACFDCLLVIDGACNQQACMTEIRAGMVLERQPGYASISVDTDSLGQSM